MLFYGKTAVGLGDSLNIPATTAELIEKNLELFENYLIEKSEDYKVYISTYNSGKDTKKSRHEFIKSEHKSGRFLPEITTADDLIDRFYTTFPNINSYLLGCADTAVIQNFIRTPDPIGRVRKFTRPNTNGEENAIRRAAMNMPIQGASGNMTKYAICLIKKYTEDNNLDDRLKFVLPIHDELRYICREDFAEEGLQIVISKMEQAAEFILGNSLLKAEGEITEFWQK